MQTVFLRCDHSVEYSCSELLSNGKLFFLPGATWKRVKKKKQLQDLEIKNVALLFGN